LADLGLKELSPVGGKSLDISETLLDHGMSSRSRAHRLHLAMMAMKTDKGEVKMQEVTQTWERQICHHTCWVNADPGLIYGTKL